MDRGGWSSSSAAQKAPETMTTKIPVTAVVPILNEESNLANCLSALRNFEAIVVVDSGSTDRSCEIAKRYGAEMVHFNWDGKFPKKRNWILENYGFRTEWVIFVDADEEVTPDFERALTVVLPRREHKGYWLSYRNQFQGRQLRFGVPQLKLALFEVGSGFYERVEENRWSRFDMEIHEHPIISGTIGIIREPLNHYDYNGMHRFVAKHNEYSDWEAHRYLALLRDEHAWSGLTRRQKFKYWLIERSWFWVAYTTLSLFVKMGIFDGSAGFHYAILKGFYFHQVYLKIRELKRVEQHLSAGKIGKACS
jgi:glycosyltransferase involved in cell wall biosynthesis